MLVSEAIRKVRDSINDTYDTGYKDSDIIGYINMGIKYLSGVLIARNEPILVKEYDVSSSVAGNPVPHNFVRFAGGFPVMRKGQKFYVVNTMPLVTIKYFYMPDDVKQASDSMPFEDEEVYQMLVISLARIYALNQHEFNVSQDAEIHKSLEGVVNSALGVVE